MSDDELRKAIEEIIEPEFGDECDVFTDGKIWLDINTTPKQIVAIAELLKKEGRV